MTAEPSVTPAGLVIADSGRYDTLVGGIQIGPAKPVPHEGGLGFIRGTLGLIVQDNVTGDRAMLSNAHVLFGKEGDGIATGCPVSQPGQPAVPPDGRDYPNVCAEVTRQSHGIYPYFGKPYFLDAAIANLRRGENGLDYIRPSRSIVNGKEGIWPEAGRAKESQWVWKVGAETGYTKGAIMRTNWDRIAGTHPQSIVVTSYNGEPFAKNGDSGSLIFSQDDNRIVGLLYAGFKSEIFATIPEIETFAFACHIIPVLAALNISFRNLG